jgi:O-methyltransferase
MNRILRNLGRCLPARWRQRLKRGLLLRCPSLYATEYIRYEQGLTCEEEVQALLSKLDATLGVPGDIIECGCFLCGTTYQMARHLQRRGSGKRIYACDTFRGFDPAEFAREIRRGHAGRDRDFAENDLSYVRRKIERLGVSQRISLVQGLFQETLESLPGPFAFAFIDCDLHDSMLYAARAIWPRLSPGGCCVFDDYTNERFRGATKAVEAFLAEQGHTIAGHGPLLHKMYFAHKAAR